MYPQYKVLVNLKSVRFWDQICPPHPKYMNDENLEKG